MGIYHFRCAFKTGVVPPERIARVSADQRFRLFLNGAFIGSGPARGDPQHWRYECVDLAPMLRPGWNILAAVVWYGTGATSGLNQIGVAPGFLLDADKVGSVGGDESAIDTGVARWKVCRNPGHSFLAIRPGDVSGYVAVAATERIEAGLFPWGWAQSDFDDSAWVAAEQRSPGRSRGTMEVGGAGGHALEASPLPAQELVPQKIGRVVRVEGLVEKTLPEGALESVPCVVPPKTKARILVDHTDLTTAMVCLETTQGNGATVRLCYAEALVDGHGHKGDRNEIAGRHCQGYADEFILDGQPRNFEPLYWRTFRYLQIEIESADEPVVLHRLTTVFTGAPLRPSATFRASDPQLATIWEVGVRTVRCNAHETFSDCPYYEQLQYVGDTRLSALTSFAFAGPRALPIVRNALALFDASRVPEGITQSRYPSTVVQLIPPFSLLYVEMIHDLWMHSADPEEPAFICGLLPGVRGVLDWFPDRVNPRGLLGPLPWWSFVDWAFRAGGSPPGAVDPDLGGSSILTLQLILALRAAAALEESLGERGRGESNRRLAGQLGERVRALCWDGERGIMADVPLRHGTASLYSEHALCLAILGGVLTREENTLAAQSLLDAITGKNSHDLIPAGLYFRYYVHRALVVAGQGDRYTEWLEPWRRALASGLTTWPENAPPSRSDCHAWSAHPTRDLLTVVLGVESAAPGFAEVSISPHLGKLDWAEGVVPHPQGEISVKLRRIPTGVHAEVTLPNAVQGSLNFGGVRHAIDGHFSGVLPAV